MQIVLKMPGKCIKFVRLIIFGPFQPLLLVVIKKQQRRRRIVIMLEWALFEHHQGEFLNDGGAKNERSSMSDPSEVMGGSDLRCLKPQSQKFQSRELEIAFEPMCAQIRPMRTFLSCLFAPIQNSI